MRHIRGSRSPVPLLITLAGLIVVFAIAFAITLLWPQALLAGIVIASCGFILSLLAVRSLTGRRWAPWLIGPAVALAGLGTIMLAEDIALSQVGEVTEAVVIDHDIEQKVVHVSRSRDRTVHTHTYALEDAEGRPLDPLVYRGEGGYDGVDVGDDITVLVDPQGRAETEPAENIDIGADIAILIIGGLAAIGAFGILMLVVGLNGRLHRPRRETGVTD